MGRRLFQVFSLVLVFLAGTVFFANTSYAQSTDELTGVWLNADLNTGGIIAIVIRDRSGTMTVQAFGACTPNPCDWGEVEGIAYSKSVGDPVGRGFTAFYDPGFAETILTGFRLEDNFPVDLLVTFGYTKFKDASGRYNYYSMEVFWRVPEAGVTGPTLDFGFRGSQLDLLRELGVLPAK